MTSQASPTSRPLWQAYASLLVPMMLTNMLQAASGTIDGIWIGQLLGTDAIAAVSVFFPVLYLQLAIVIGLSTGATVLIGQAWGSEDIPRVRHIAGTALATTVALGALLGIGGAACALQIVRALGTPDAIVDPAVSYARLMMLGCPAIFGLWLLTSISRGVGDATSPLWALAIATAVSLLLTPAFIRGFGGLPAAGVASAALSTIIGFVLAIVWLGWRWRYVQHPLAPRWPTTIVPDCRLLVPILRIGSAVAAQMVAMGLGELAIVSIANTHGPDATAVYGAVSQVVGWIRLPVMSIGTCATILAAHMIGARRPEGIRRVLATGLFLNVQTTGLFVAAAYLLGDRAVRLFIVDAATADQAKAVLDTVAWSMVALGWSAVFSGVMRADGTVAVPTVISVATVALVQVPIAYVANARIGIAGIWAGYTVQFMCSFVLQALYCLLVWRLRPARRLA